MRLNKETRSQIVENAFKASSIPAARKALTERSIILSEKIRFDSLETPTLDDDLRSAEKEIKLILKKRGIPDAQAPGRLFSRDSSMYAKFASDTYSTVCFNGLIRERDYSSSPTLVHRGDSESKFVGKEVKSYDADHEFTQEWRALRNAGQQLIEDEKVLRNTVQAAVDSFNTVEKLVEHWPEVESLLPKDIAKATAPMPIALRVDVLNTLIGLPK